MTQATAASTFKVLVVEDSPQVRDRLLDMLDSIDGVDAIGSADRADVAVTRILAERPDAVILDINLAQGSGLDVLRAVHQAAPGVELWMHTNYADEPYRAVCRRLGAARFFDKSSDFEQMRESIVARAAQLRIH
jgi:DNA-binding NarL/FixJ family response regulator